MNPVIVIQGASKIDEVPRLGELSDQAELRFASSPDELREALPGAEIMLGRNFQDDWALYTAGKQPLNVVDKSLGFVPSAAP